MRPTRLAHVFLLATLTGCARLAHGTTQDIPIASSPPGALVLIDDKPVGVAPIVVATMGLMVGIGSGDEVPAAMFFGGGGLLIGTRIWEVVDLVKRTGGRARKNLFLVAMRTAVAATCISSKTHRVLPPCGYRSRAHSVGAMLTLAC